MNAVLTAHGNMVAMLSRSGTNGYALSNQRSFDAWGNVRIGSSTGNPTGRYCANIGHKQDDESGLIYMRARYYEPTSGRFVSQDPAMDGDNWYIYCFNNPVSNVDMTGKLSWFEGNFLLGILEFFAAAVVYMKVGAPLTQVERIVAAGLLTVASFHFAEALGESCYSSNRLLKYMAMASTYAGVIATILEGVGKAKWAQLTSKIAIIASAVYSTVILGMLIGVDVEASGGWESSD